MDSANSGSMQSSSGGGGDEEYESRGESFTSFLNPSSGQFGSISDHQPPPPPSFLSHQYQNTLFNPNNTQNLEAQYGGNDIVWSSRGLSSQTNHHHNFENLIALSSSSSSSLLSSNQSLFGTTHMLNQPQFANSSSSSSMTSQSSIEANNNNNPPRKSSDHPSITKNPKKRTRASRRAPTTVLPTDTTNFRQMVQQFTGIPTAPFSSSSSPYSRRQDLFSGGLSGMRSGNNNNNNLDALNLGNPLYPLRPSAQKFQFSPFLPQSAASPTSPSTLSSTMIEALMSSTTNTMNQSTTNNAQSTTTPQNLLSMQNQILSFHQSALPTSLKNSSPIFGINSQSDNTTTTTIGVAADVTPRNLGSAIQHGGVTGSSFDDFGLRHENINSGNYNLSDKGLENVVSSSGEGTVGPWISPSEH